MFTSAAIILEKKQKRIIIDRKVHDLQYMEFKIYVKKDSFKSKMFTLFTHKLEKTDVRRIYYHELAETEHFNKLSINDISSLMTPIIKEYMDNCLGITMKFDLHGILIFVKNE